MLIGLRRSGGVVWSERRLNENLALGHVGLVVLHSFVNLMQSKLSLYFYLLYQGLSLSDTSEESPGAFFFHPVWQEKPFEFLDPLPGPSTFADEEPTLNDEAVKDNLCGRNPKRKGRPNDKVVQAQLACGSDDDISSESASPVPSDEDESDFDDSSPRRAKACPVSLHLTCHLS